MLIVNFQYKRAAVKLNLKNIVRKSVCSDWGRDNDAGNVDIERLGSERAASYGVRGNLEIHVFVEMEAYVPVIS